MNITVPFIETMTRYSSHRISLIFHLFVYQGLYVGHELEL